MGKRKKKKKHKRTTQKAPKPFSDLIVAIDRSQKQLKSTRVTIYSWVGIEKGEPLHQLKQRGNWLQHVSELDKKRRQSYRKRFYGKFPTQLRPLFKEVEITQNPRTLKDKLHRTPYSVLLLEDKLYEKGKFPTEKAIKENIAKRHTEYKPVMLVADNVAYFGREILEQKYTKNISTAEIKALLRKLGIKLTE